MSSSNGLTRFVVIGALTFACGTLYSTPAAAANYRSFYQNAGASCHGVDALSDAKLTRTEGRLINKTNSSIDVICNLMTDVYAPQSTNKGVVTFVALWARRYAGTGRTMSCTLTDGFYGQTGSTTYQPDVANPLSLPNSGAQAIFTWTPGNLATSRFLAPVNVRCTLAGYTELNDMFVEYEGDIGTAY
ncbi:hypothetical protein [Thermomonas sp.]|uniref:hypothetical protein n=1 Tax=Thermomonas sp. TaxID=1971895 RepID=UPI0035B4975B